METNSTQRRRRQNREINQRIGARIRHYRQRAKADIDEMTERLGIRREKLDRYEKGQATIPVHDLVNIAFFLDVPTQALTEAWTPPARFSSRANFETPLEAMKEMPPDWSEMLLQLLTILHGASPVRPSHDRK